MKILTTFDDGFLPMAHSFVNSLRGNSATPLFVHLSRYSSKSIEYCKNNDIEHKCSKMPKLGPKPTSRLLKMGCADDCGDETVAYMDIDIIFQRDIATLEDLNPNYLWVLSKREGHQTALRKWKKHYFAKNDVGFVRKHLPKLDSHVDVEKALKYPVRNCGVIYSSGTILRELFHLARDYYSLLLKLNKKARLFSESDQLCFLLAFMKLEEKREIKELPLKFNRMPYHQSYDFKDKSCFLIPENVVLHLNRCKELGRPLIKSWAANKRPIIVADENTRCGIVIPIQTSSVAERALTKNLYSLAVSNKANIYRDEDVGFPITKKLARLDRIRDGLKGERPAFDKGLFFLFNNFLFMIDHGEHVGNRAAWIIAKHVKPKHLAGVFVEQMEEKSDYSKAKIPVLPIAYGTKQPLLWLNQGEYHDLGLHSEKKHSVHFIGSLGTNRERKRHASILSSIPDSKIENRGNSKRLDFDGYMRDMAASRFVWCPPGGRPKTHREIEAYCCEVAVLMPEQHIIEPESVEPDIHYICVKSNYSDAPEKVAYYLEHPDELGAIAWNGRLWYEKYASDNARARYIYEECCKIISRIKS